MCVFVCLKHVRAQRISVSGWLLPFQSYYQSSNMQYAICIPENKPVANTATILVKSSSAKFAIILFFQPAVHPPPPPQSVLWKVRGCHGGCGFVLQLRSRAACSCSVSKPWILCSHNCRAPCLASTQMMLSGLRSSVHRNATCQSSSQAADKGKGCNEAFWKPRCIVHNACLLEEG